MRNVSLDDFVEGVIKNNPTETQRGWELAAWQEFEKDVAVRRAFFNYGVANYFKSHDVVTASPDEIAIQRRSRHYTKSARPKTRAARKQQKEKQRTVVGLTMFKWIMQQRCGDLARMGGAFSVLAKCGKPNQVLGNVVSTMQARDVLRRQGCEVPNFIPAENPNVRAA